jgi:hypothetical protein
VKRETARMNVCGRLLVAAIAVLVVAIFVAVPSARALGACGLGCAPTVSAPSASAVTPTSATLSATVNPDGETTTYNFVIEKDGIVDDGVASPRTTISAGSVARTVTWQVADLIPNATYDTYLAATNSTGTSSAVYGSFQTSILPALSVTLTPAYPAIAYGLAPMFTARVGAGNSCASVELQTRDQFGRWQTIDDQYSSADGVVSFHESTSFEQNTVVRAYSTGISTCYDNAEFSGTLWQPSASAAVTQYVLPSVGLAIYNTTNQSLYNVTAGIAGAARYLTPVYMYAERGQTGVFTRLMRIHTWHFRLRAAHLDSMNGWFLLCSRARVSSKEGPPFSYPACGARTLRKGGPAGAQFILRNSLFHPSQP